MDSRGSTQPREWLSLPTLTRAGYPGSRLLGRALTFSLGLLGLILAACAVSAFAYEVSVIVRGSGTLQPVRLRAVRAPETGRVQELAVSTGARVREGQVLVRLDPLPLESALRSLEAQRSATMLAGQRASAEAPVEEERHALQIARAQARLAAAREALLAQAAEEGRGRDVDSLLAAYRMGENAALDRAVSEVRALEMEERLARSHLTLLRSGTIDRERDAAALAELDAQIDETRRRLSRLSVVAPIPGVVISERLDRLEGAVVTAGEVLLEIASPEHWKVELYVAERPAYQIRTGDRVRVHIRALGADQHEPLHGRVESVSAEPMDPGPQSGRPTPGLYRVTALLDSRQLGGTTLERLRRGYSVDGEVITETATLAELVWEYLAGPAR